MGPDISTEFWPDADLVYPAPIPKPTVEATPKKQITRRDSRTVRHTRNPKCGHKIVVGHEPRHRNCEVCWFSFFQVNGQITQVAEEVYQKHGRQGLIQFKGPKFVEYMLKFLGTVAQYKAALEAAKGSGNQNESGSIEGTDEQGEEAAVPATVNGTGYGLIPS